MGADFMPSLRWPSLLSVPTLSRSRGRIFQGMIPADLCLLFSPGCFLVEGIECFAPSGIMPLRRGSVFSSICSKRWATGLLPIGRSLIGGIALRFGAAPELRSSPQSWKMADQAMIRRLENTALQFEDLTNQLADPEVSNALPFSSL